MFKRKNLELRSCITIYMIYITGHYSRISSNYSRRPLRSPQYRRFFTSSKISDIGGLDCTYFSYYIHFLGFLKMHPLVKDCVDLIADGAIDQKDRDCPAVQRLQFLLEQQMLAVGMVFNQEIYALFKKYSVMFQSGLIGPQDHLNGILSYKATLKEIDLTPLLRDPTGETLNEGTKAAFPLFVKEVAASHTTGTLVWRKTIWTTGKRTRNAGEHSYDPFKTGKMTIAEEFRFMISEMQRFIGDVAKQLDYYWWRHPSNWANAEEMDRTAGGFLNHVEVALGYKSLVTEVFSIPLKGGRPVEYAIDDLKSLVYRGGDDITEEHINILIEELRAVKGRTLCEGIKGLWSPEHKGGLDRVQPGVQLLLLTVSVMCYTEAICETYGSVMERSQSTQFAASPDNEDKSCQKHVFISMNGPAPVHAGPLLTYLCEGPFKNRVFATAQYCQMSLHNIIDGNVISHLAAELDKKRRRTRFGLINTLHETLAHFPGDRD